MRRCSSGRAIMSMVFEPISDIKRPRERDGGRHLSITLLWPDQPGKKPAGNRTRLMTKSRNRTFGRTAGALIAMSLAGAFGAAAPAVAPPHLRWRWLHLVLTPK